MKLPSQNSKERRVLSAFLAGGTYNRFQAENQLHDHCLNSTVSTLQKKLGLPISRKIETVPGYLGIPTRCCRYWIDPEVCEQISSYINR